MNLFIGKGFHPFTLNQVTYIIVKPQGLNRRLVGATGWQNLHYYMGFWRFRPKYAILAQFRGENILVYFVPKFANIDILPTFGYG